MTQDRIYKYFERNPDLRVLFIFDNEIGSISADLSECTWDESQYVYKVFDGTWFNTKYNIENIWKDKKVVLLFPEHTAPRKEEDMLKFPLLDMLRANMEYKEDDYSTFLQQYNLPYKYASLIQNHISELLSSKVSAIINGYLTPETFSKELMFRAFISSYLGEKKLLDWADIIVRAIIADYDKANKKYSDFFIKLNKNKDAYKEFSDKLSSIFGVTISPNTEYKMKSVVECLKYNSITQLLDTVKADDYKQYKITNANQLNQINKIYDTGNFDRNLSEKFGAALALIGCGIKEERIIDYYGIDAEFFYMTEKICWPILNTLIKERLSSDPDSVNEKMRELSLKFPETSDAQILISFIEKAALYYSAVRSTGTLKLNSPNEYVCRYKEEFYLIDRYYRHSLEAYHELIKKDIPFLQSINDAKNELDKSYAQVSNILNLEWLTCVKEFGDYFDSVSLPKQEDFYAENLDASTKKVVIVCDALRYELAVEMMEELAKEKHMAKLSAMRAMLPTETKFCKPALFPHNELSLQGTDMTVDGNILSSTDQRTAHIAKYREDAVCVKYDEVMNGSQQNMRELFKRPLVYVLYDTIDETGHPQNPFEIIRACRNAIEQISVLVKRLHSTYNVVNVYVTSDHGFIYNDILFEEKDKHSITEDCIEKKTRYYLTNSSAAVSGIIKFPLDKVSGMSTPSSVYVGVPEGTNRLAAPGGYSFAHGGASLQEMIIPLIHSTQKRTNKTEKVGITLLSHNLNMVSSQLRFQIIQAEAVSMTAMERTITCCIFSGDEPVTDEKEILLNSPDSTDINKRIFDITLKLNKSVSSGILQLRIYDIEDQLNPLLKETVKNNTIIEQDF